MKRVLVAGAAAFLLAVPAAAFEFDNSTCKEFLAGTWNSEADIDQGGQKFHYKGHSVYNADGTLTQHRVITQGETVVKEIDAKGTWDAKAGAKPDECEATVTIEGAQTMTAIVTVIDENSVKGPDGNTATREH